MEAAITFADTGHLCLGTLHSSNAYQTLHRVMNFFPGERQDDIYLQLSMNLRAIISQRLIPSTDGKRRGRRGNHARYRLCEGTHQER